MFWNHKDAPRYIPLAVLTVSVFALAAAYTAQYVFKLEPCILCLYQRVPYAVAGLLALLALGMPSGNKRACIVAICGFVFLVGAGIAFYHVGVEQHWWKTVAGCGGSLPSEISLENLSQKIMIKQPKACDEVDWTFFGISMATYNVAASLFFGLAALLGAKRIRDIG